MTSGSARRETYPQALVQAGRRLGIPVEPFWLTSHEELEGVDGILFTGGADVDPIRYGREADRTFCEIEPQRDEFEFDLLKRGALETPILAVCRGAQVLNVFHGGTLIPHLDTVATHVGTAGGGDAEHEVVVAQESTIAEFASDSAEINSSHHQAVDALAAPFRAIAHAPDGTLEAYEYAESAGRPFFLALQWHPERMQGRPLGDGPMDLFIKACAADAHYALLD